jgi:hypothetical protein
MPNGSRLADPGLTGHDLLWHAADAGALTQALRAELGEQLRRCRELCREAQALRDDPRPSAAVGDAGTAAWGGPGHNAPQAGRRA